MSTLLLLFLSTLMPLCVFLAPLTVALSHPSPRVCCCLLEEPPTLLLVVRQVRPVAS